MPASFLVLPAMAADDSSSNSMDSIWVDSAVKSPAAKDGAAAGSAEPTTLMTPPGAPAAKAAAGAAPTQAPGRPSAAPPVVTATATPPPALDTAAPMCTVNAFKDSPLVTGSGWAGIGPFKADGSDFVDEKNNRVKLDLEGDQITRAELTLSAYDANRDPVMNQLNLEMQIDFLLESLGIKPSRIQALNVQLDRRKEALLNDPQPLNVTGGHYSVVIEKRPSSGGTDYLITVNSMDMNKKAIKQPWVSEKPRESSHHDHSFLSQPEEKTTAPAADREELKAEFVDLISKWQKVKKEAVKTKQYDQLATVLSGRALAAQTGAVKYLISNHCYYEMNTKGVTVDQLTEILPGKKFMVAAQVREAYKFIDEQTGKVLKEHVDDINRVNYTIEKTGNKWVISDSKLLSANPTRAVAKSPH